MAAILKRRHFRFLMKNYACAVLYVTALAAIERPCRQCKNVYNNKSEFVAMYVCQTFTCLQYSRSEKYIKIKYKGVPYLQLLPFGVL